MAFDISKVPPEDSRGFQHWRGNANPSDVASYYKMKGNQQEQDPIQSAINGVTSTAPVSLSVDSLDQAITPIAADRTTTQLLSDFGVAPQQETAVTAGSAVSPKTWVSGGAPNLNAEGIDLNKTLATNSYGGALKYSQLPPEDQAVVDARRASGQTSSQTPYKGATALMNEVNYGVGQQYDSPEEALSALPSFLSSLKEKSVATDAEFNTKNYDPSEFTMAGVSPVGGVSGRAAKESAVDYLTKNKIPMSIEVDGQTRYLTTGLGSDVYKADDNFERKAGSYEDFGPVGTYSTVHVKPDNVFDSPLLNVVGMFVPQIALMTTALKVAAGEKITPMEIVGAGMAGLEYAGAIKAPTGAAAGGVGPVDKGQGLFGTTYNQTETLMKAAAADNLEGGVVQVFAPQVIDSVMSKVPSIELPETGLPEDFEAGLVKTVEKMAGGSSFDDAIKAGGIEYIREGGFKPLEGVIKEAVKPIGEILDPIADALKTVTEPTKEFLSEANQTIREELKSFDKEVLQPVTQPIGDVLSAADTVVRQTLPDIGLPSLDLNLSGLLTGTGAVATPQLPATRTTDNLFKDELFKFKTEIGVDVNPLEYVDLNAPTENFFEDPILGRSYNF